MVIREEESPTPINFSEAPVLGIAKRVSQGPSLDIDENYVLTYEIRVENLGNIDLLDLQVTDDLSTTFNGSVAWEFVSIESEEFTVNDDFDGLTDTNLLQGDDILWAGNEGAIYVTVKVAPGGFAGPYLNTAIATALSPSDQVLTDLSQNGSEPDPDQDGDPTNNNDPTPVILDCFVGIICPAVVDTITVENDNGWCSAFVNFPPAEIITCAGAPGQLD